METKHTAGPWYQVEKGMIASKTVQTDRNIAIVFDCFEEHEANARLIAAAPELLKALKSCIDNIGHYATMNHDPDGHRKFAEARAVINKATKEV